MPYWYCDMISRIFLEADISSYRTEIGLIVDERIRRFEIALGDIRETTGAGGSN
jgi:hypothetical protein